MKLTYEKFFAEPMDVFSAAELITFKDGLIVRDELFFHARPVVRN